MRPRTAALPVLLAGAAVAVVSYATAGAAAGAGSNGGDVADVQLLHCDSPYRQDDHACADMMATHYAGHYDSTQARVGVHVLLNRLLYAYVAGERTPVSWQHRDRRIFWR